MNSDDYVADDSGIGANVSDEPEGTVQCQYTRGVCFSSNNVITIRLSTTKTTDDKHVQ